MLWIGTSGWQYKDWRGRFYPERLPQIQWLPYYGERFDTVEVNNTFYRLPKREAFQGWADRSPDGFVVTVKVSRYLTHIRRLREPEGPAALLLERAQPLVDAGKLGPLLVQLPPNMSVDIARLCDTLAAFPRHLRIAVEPRHDSWWTDDVAAALAQHDAALVWADRGSKVITPLWRTASWGYVRLHEGRATPRPCYGRTALDSWVERIAGEYGPDDDVYTYFNNDWWGCAVRDAVWFARAARRHGLRPTRVPDRIPAYGP